jgi:hypothetical protein
MIWALLILLTFPARSVAEDKFQKRTFETRVHVDKDDYLMSITYYIKESDGFQPGSPIFYGTAGQERVENMRDRYVSLI